MRGEHNDIAVVYPNTVQAVLLSGGRNYVKMRGLASPPRGAGGIRPTPQTGGLCVGKRPARAGRNAVEQAAEARRRGSQW